MNRTLAKLLVSIFISNGFLIVGPALAQTLPSSTPASETTKPQDSIPGQIIVKFKSTGGSSLTKSANTVINARSTFKSSTKDGSSSLDKLVSKYKVRNSGIYPPISVFLLFLQSHRRVQ